MRSQHLLSLLFLAGCAGCGDSFAVPTPSGTERTTQAPGLCTPGNDPNCPAIQGSVAGVAFDFVAHAGFAACGDENSQTAIRLLITDGDNPCDGAFVTGTSTLRHGTRALLFEFAGASPISLGAYANDANGQLILPTLSGDGNSVANPNTAQNPNGVFDPNTVSDPNTVANPNSLAVPRAAAAPQALGLPNAEPLGIESLSFGAWNDAVRAGTFHASHAGSAALHGSFAATACVATIFCGR